MYHPPPSRSLEDLQTLRSQEDMSPRAKVQVAPDEIVDLESGIDWITHIADQRRDVEPLADLAESIQREDLANGSDRKPWRFMGYSGWRTASIRLGWRSGSLCLQCSGPSAEPIAMRMRSSSGRTTRLDAQVTLTLSSALSSFATACIGRSTAHRQSRPQCLPQRGLSRLSTGLCIGTVGPRTAPRYLRVYDKGVEQRTHPPGYRWRLELEAKAGLAEELWKEVRSQEDVRGWCYESVESQWRSSGSHWPLPKSSRERSAVRAPERGPAPAVSLMAWLRTTVAPTMPRVLTCYSVSDVLAALGLEDHAIPRQRSHPDHE